MSNVCIFAVFIGKYIVFSQVSRFFTSKFYQNSLLETMTSYYSNNYTEGLSSLLGDLTNNSLFFLLHLPFLSHQTPMRIMPSTSDPAYQTYYYNFDTAPRTKNSSCIQCKKPSFIKWVSFSRRVQKIVYWPVIDLINYLMQNLTKEKVIILLHIAFYGGNGKCSRRRRLSWLLFLVTLLPPYS